MNKKILTGVFTGIFAGITIALVINYKNKIHFLKDEEPCDENDILEKANQYLLKAKNEADELVAEAESRSNSILDEAGRILLLAKERTSSLHYDHTESAHSEIVKIKEEIDMNIEEFKRRLSKD